MKTDEPLQDYLVLSRGRWDADVSPADIQQTIDEFYIWLTRCIDEGRVKMGSRLRTERAMVSREGIVTDGPFGEAKEIVGGYWFIVARSLDEAAQLAAQNPCARYGLCFEIRPLEPERATAFQVTNETPRA